MTRKTYTLELITPCFCAGANAAEAEIRAPSIRGQLRWWFRTLGGFRSLTTQALREQEAMIFGETTGDHGRSGNLLVRVSPRRLVSGLKDGQELGHPNFSDPAFLTFPMQSRERNGSKIQYNGRGVITAGSFDVILQWKGSPKLWDDILALLVVFGHLGSLGYRGRRAMGALAFSEAPQTSLASALQRFASYSSIVVKALPALSAKDAVSVLGSWLRSCRSHGRSADNERERKSPYFQFALNDHDIGYALQGTQGLDAFRPALGLPIIQRTQRGTNHWEWEWNQRKNKAEGRFASPVLLRPHRDAQGAWRALVIFVDSHSWPAGKQVFLNGQRRNVSLDLYNAMKADPSLQPFP